MNTLLHTVLGASGAVGRAVVNDLTHRGLPIRAVSRTTILPGVESKQADLLNLFQTKDAIQGSSHVYLCVGLPYSTKVWKQEFPRIMKNVIVACEEANAVLIFLDNAYMYGPSPLKTPIDEQHLQQPVAKKGYIRKEVADILLQAIADQQIQAVIGRASEFYGPYAKNSMFYISFLERMLQGKAPQVLCKPSVQHMYAYTEDIGRALVALALDTSTYGSVWHLPVGAPVTIEDMTATFNEVLNTNFSTSFMPSLVRHGLSPFISPLREVGEMLYQFETDYVFSFDKFQRKFPDFKVTPYEEGVKKMVDSFQE